MGEDEHGKKIKRKKKIQNGADPKDNIYNVVVFCSIFDCLTYDIEKKELNIIINKYVYYTFI